MSRRLSQSLFASLLLAVPAAAAPPHSLAPLCGGAPAITVTSISIAASCAQVESDCVKVDWTASAPISTTISGFRLRVKVDPPGTCAVQVSNQTAAGSARSAIVSFPTCGGLAGAPIEAIVTADYAACSNGQKSQGL